MTEPVNRINSSEDIDENATGVIGLKRGFTMTLGSGVVRVGIA